MQFSGSFQFYAKGSSDVVSHPFSYTGQSNGIFCQLFTVPSFRLTVKEIFCMYDSKISKWIQERSLHSLWYLPSTLPLFVFVTIFSSKRKGIFFDYPKLTYPRSVACLQVSGEMCISVVIIFWRASIPLESKESQNHRIDWCFIRHIIAIIFVL